MLFKLGGIGNRHVNNQYQWVMKVSNDSSSNNYLHIYIIYKCILFTTSLLFYIIHELWHIDILMESKNWNSAALSFRHFTFTT